MVLDFDPEIVITILICITVIIVVKLTFSFIEKRKIDNRTKQLIDAIKNAKGFDYDIDKERIEKRDKENAEKHN